MNRVLLLVVAFIVYGSLYPWKYRPAPAGQSAVQVLLESWPDAATNADLGDILVNLVIYVPLGMFGFLAFDRARRLRLRWVGPVALAFVLSVSMELLQVYDATRECSLLDVLNNTLGGLAGTFVGYFFRRSLSAGVFLAFQWLGFQTVAGCAIAIGKRAAPHLSLLEAVSYLAAWCVAVYLIVRPGKSSVWLAGGFLGLLFVRGMAPFHFKAVPTPFLWIPMHTLLSTEWVIGLPTFFEKCFYYGSAVWLFRSAGWSPWRATVVVAAVLGAIEMTQRYLPGRTPEITDPFLALALGLMLWLIEQDYEHHHSSGMQSVREAV